MIDCWLCFTQTMHFMTKICHFFCHQRQVFSKVQVDWDSVPNLVYGFIMLPCFPLCYQPWHLVLNWDWIDLILKSFLTWFSQISSRHWSRFEDALPGNVALTHTTLLMFCCSTVTWLLLTSTIWHHVKTGVKVLPTLVGQKILNWNSSHLCKEIKMIFSMFHEKIK